MNNKGFTLIELVATIALLSVIVIISFVSINGVIQKSKVNNCKSLVNNIKAAAKEYVSDNRYKITSTDTGVDQMDGIDIKRNDDINYMSFNAQKLIDKKYLNTDSIDNPYSKGSTITPSEILITITFNSNYTVKNVKIENDGILTDASDNECPLR